MGVKIPSKQRTLKNEVVISGSSFVSKNKCTIKLVPAKRNTGIVFVKENDTITADLFSLCTSFSNTTLRDGEFYISGVEHLLSALFGMFVDNVEIEMLDEYLPSGDGSPSVFYNAITNTGVVEQDANRRCLHITRAFSVQDNGSFVSIAPGDSYSVTYTMGKPYPNTVHGTYRFTLDGSSYINIHNARTWADKSHVLNLYKKGVTGINSSNCIILNNGTFSNNLRHEKELLQHKVVDCIGDLSLLFGMYIKGEVVAYNAGHKLHHKLMKGILNDPSICNDRRF